MDAPQANRQLALARPALRAVAPPVGLAAAMVGLALAFGIMAVEASKGADYTLISWVAIGPTWGAAALLSVAMRWWPSASGFLLGWLSIFAGFYFADVFGFAPAAVLFILGTAGVVLANDNR